MPWGSDRVAESFQADFSDEEYIGYELLSVHPSRIERSPGRRKDEGTINRRC